MGGIRVWKIRLEKIDKSTKSWWAPASSDLISSSVTASVSVPTEIRKCDTCCQESKLIYTAGWTCLNERCEEFFKTVEEYDGDQSLDYNEAFLNERNEWTGGALPPLALTPPTMESLESTGTFGYEKQYSQGIVCSECGCCSRRLQWTHWECENKDCKAVYEVPQKPVSIDQLADESTKRNAKKMAELFEDGITMEESVCGSYTVRTYRIPDPLNVREIIGFVRHFKSCEKINKQEHGPNQLFEELQALQLKLARNPVRQAGGKF